jgi:hypothetical protein
VSSPPWKLTTPFTLAPLKANSITLVPPKPQYRTCLQSGAMDGTDAITAGWTAYANHLIDEPTS